MPLFLKIKNSIISISLIKSLEIASFCFSNFEFIDVTYNSEKSRNKPGPFIPGLGLKRANL